MVVERRFLIASSIARLLRRENPEFIRLIEGYFPPRRERIQLVRAEGDQCFLVLRLKGATGLATEERHDLPVSQAEALMDVAAGRIAYDRTDLTLSSNVRATLDRFFVPAGLDILTLAFASESGEFVAPRWVGQEVTDDLAFEAAHLALHGFSGVEPPLQITNEAVEALLDWMEDPSRTELTRPPAASSPTADEHRDAEPQPSHPNARYAVFRIESPEPDDDGVVRLARSLAPRRNPG